MTCPNCGSSMTTRRNREPRSTYTKVTAGVGRGSRCHSVFEVGSETITERCDKCGYSSNVGYDPYERCISSYTVYDESSSLIPDRRR